MESHLAVPSFLDWPKPNSLLLAGIVDSLRARSKAINNRVHKFDVAISTDSDSGSTYERLNLKLDSWQSRPDWLTFVFWDDGTMWLDARRKSKTGWHYKFSFYADVNDIDSDIIRDAIENSLWIDSESDMQSVWSQFNPKAE